MRTISEVQHVFIIGAKEIPSAYGGYETFVDKLTEYHQNLSAIKYHVACKSKGRGVSAEMAKRALRYEYHNADCFKVDIPEIGAAEAVVYDCRAFNMCLSYIKKNNIKKPIVYVLTCRIGPFISWYKRKLKKLGGVMFLNPNGHEWKRKKWSKPVRWYWKKSEELMVKHADMVVCDSKNIEKYIQYTTINPTQESLIKDQVNAQVAIEVSKASEEAVAKRRDEKAKELDDFPQEVQEYMNLQRDTVIKEGIYTDLIKQMENNKIRQAMDSMDIQVVDRANLPFAEKPEWPRPKLMTAAGFVFGCLLSFMYMLRIYKKEM